MVSQAAPKLKPAVLIEGDASMRNLMVSYLNGVGIKHVTAFASGQEGWEAIKTGGAELIILDWKVKGLSAFALLARIRRRDELASTPLLILGGGLSKEDARLLQEQPFTYFLEKPFQQPVFAERLAKINEDRAWHQSQKDKIDAVFGLCSSDGDLAVAASMRLLKEAKNGAPLAVVFGRRLLESGFKDAAELILKRALEIDVQCTSAMNELARIMRARGKYKEALNYLTEANKIAPKNLERLCLLGETEINLKSPGKALNHFQAALALDPEDERAKAGKEIVGNIDKYLADTGRKLGSMSVASLLNNAGIVLVRQGKFEAGLKHYLTTLGLLNDRTTKGRISFNMGLGFLRWQKVPEAREWFNRSLEFNKSTANRSHHFLAKLPAMTPKQTTTKAKVELNDTAINYGNLDKDISAFEGDLEGDDDLLEESIGAAAPKPT